MLDCCFCVCVDDVICEGLKVLGYYELMIEFDLCLLLKRGCQVLIVKVILGELVCIGGIEVILCGGVCIDSDYLVLLKMCLVIGMVFNYGDYDGFKSLLICVVLCKGYFDSEFFKSQFGVFFDCYQVFWDIDYDSGECYCFGYVIFFGL